MTKAVIYTDPETGHVELRLHLEKDEHEPDDRPEVRYLFANLKAALPDLKKLLEDVNDHWAGEDGFYRFYHQSFKVYRLQSLTVKIVEALQKLAPEHEMNVFFETIFEQGTGKGFASEANDNWLGETRPIVEAFFHARELLVYAIKYASEYDFPPIPLGSGWAAFLYFYNLR